MIIPRNMKHNILLMHKGYSELSSSLFFTGFKVKPSAVPQPSLTCVLERGRKTREEISKHRDERQATKYFYLHFCTHAIFQGLILAASRLTA